MPTEAPVAASMRVRMASVILDAFSVNHSELRQAIAEADVSPVAARKIPGLLNEQQRIVRLLRDAWNVSGPPLRGEALIDSDDDDIGIPIGPSLGPGFSSTAESVGQDLIGEVRQFLRLLGQVLQGKREALVPVAAVPVAPVAAVPVAEDSAKSGAGAG